MERVRPYSHFLVVLFCLLCWSTTLFSQRVLPSGFIPNAGWYPDSILYWAPLPDGKLFITKTGMLFEYPQLGKARSQIFLQYPFDWAMITPSDSIPLMTTVYFSHFHWSGFPIRHLILTDAAQRTELHLRIENGTLRYDFIGEFPPHLWKIFGPDSVISQGSRCIFQLGQDSVFHENLMVFSPSFEKAQKVKFRLHGNELMLENLPFSTGWIDPIVRSTFLGRSGEDQLVDVERLPNGNFVVAGWTNSAGLPFHRNSYDTTMAPPHDAFIALFNDSLHPIALTLLGGIGEDRITDIAYHEGKIWVVGTTNSPAFPITPLALQPLFQGGTTDAFIACLDTTLVTLLYASYLGGSSAEEGKKIESAGEVLTVLIETSSLNLPVSATALFPTLQGASDLYLLQFHGETYQALWSSYFGGNGADSFGDARIHGDILWITGKTSSPSFPLVSPFQNTLAGSFDAFLTALRIPQPQIVFSSYFGGSQIDFGTALDCRFGKIAIGGTTSSDDFPVSSDALQQSYQGGDDLWIAIVDSATFQVEHATYLGTQGWEQLTDLSMADDSSCIVVGWTTSTQFPVTADADQPNAAGGIDGILVHLSSDLSSLRYSSYFGSNGDDFILRLAPMPPYFLTFLVAGNSSSDTLPGTRNGYQPQNRGQRDLFLSLLSYPVIITEPDTTITVCPGDTLAIRWQSTQQVDSFFLALEHPDGQIPIASVSTTDSAYLWSVGTRQVAASEFHILALSADREKLYTRSKGIIYWNDPPTITEHPVDDTVCPGTDVLFSAYGTGTPPLQKQWERSTDGGVTWNEIPFSESFQLFLPTVSEQLNGALFRFRLSNACGTAVSKPARLTVLPAPIVGIHPTNQLVCIGDSVTFYSSAFPMDSIRWQRSTDRGQTWEEIPGANTNFYGIRISDTAVSSLLYRALFFFGHCSTASQSASIRIAPLVKILGLPQSVTACPGDEVLFRIHAENASKFRWERWDEQQQKWQLIYFQEGAQLRTVVNGKPGDTLWFRARVIGRCDTLTTAPFFAFLRPESQLLSIPSFLQFGTLTECSPSAISLVRIINRDTMSRTILSAEAPPEFAVITPLPLTIQPDDTIELQIQFTPGVQGIFQDTVWLKYDPCGYRFGIPVAGNKVQPLLLSTNRLNFGDHPNCYFPIDSSISLTNASPTDTIWFENVQLQSPFSIQSPLPPFLAPNESLFLQIRCAPGGAGIWSTLFHIPYSIHNCVDTAKIPLSAGSFAPAITPPELTLQFDSLLSCAPAKDTTIRIENQTGDTLSLLIEYTSEYIDTAYLSRTLLPPYDSAEVTLTFSPPPGFWQDSVTIHITQCQHRSMIYLASFRHQDSIAGEKHTELPPVPLTTRWYDTLVFWNATSREFFCRSVNFEKRKLFRILGTDPFLPTPLAPGDSLLVFIEFLALDTLHTDKLFLLFEGACNFSDTAQVTGRSIIETVAHWWIQPMEGKPGDTVELKIFGSFSPALLSLQDPVFRIYLRWNPTVLTPGDPLLRSIPLDGWAGMHYQDSARADTITVAIPMIVGLGDMEYSPLWIDSVLWKFPHFDFLPLPQQYNPGIFHLLTYTEGKPQLLNPQPGQLTVTILPSPLTNQSTVFITGIIHPQQLLVECYSAIGEKILSIPSSELRNLQYNAQTGRWSGEILLTRQMIGQAGLYFLRCSHGPWTITRAFLVE